MATGGGGGTGRVATERTGDVTTGGGDRRCGNWGWRQEVWQLGD